MIRNPGIAALVQDLILTVIGSCIAECGFLSNREEAKKLETEEYQDRLAWTLHMGIMEYLNQNQ